MQRSGESSAKLKKSRRDIQRLLKKPDLPANVRTQKEKMLQAIELQLEMLSTKAKARKTAKKYHMVRFFERKKALKKYKAAKKEMDALVEKDQDGSSKKEIKKARKKLSQCELDLLYVVNFPKDEKYISLYPTSKEENELEEVRKARQKTDDKRLEVRKTIKEQNENGTIPITLEEILAGKIDHNKLIESQQHVKLAEPDKVQVTQEKEEDNNDDEFFE